MQVTVRLFAILRDRSGASELTLSLSDGATVASAESALLERHPILRDFLARSAFAVNREYVSRFTELHDGDELAIIPPVSGG
jgi:molybdopterin converting factor subunit 1